jgi:uncharacterized membrane protein YbhN (UPF0104 family)
LAEGHKARNRILNILKVVISLGVLAVILSKVDMAHVLQLLSEMAWIPFGAALLLLLSGSLVRAYRWGALVWALDVDVSWWRLVSLYFVGAFFGQFLPTGVGGDAVKMYELSRDDHKASAAISSVLVDRFLGLFVLFAMALVSLIGGYRLVEPRVRIFVGVIFAGSLLGAGLVAQRTWIESWGQRLGLGRLLGRVKILGELYASLHQYGPAALARATAASVGWNLILVFGYYLLAVAVGIRLSLWHFFLFVPVISALLMVPSLGGLGIREASTTLLFTQAGVIEPKAVALALAYDMTLIVTELIGAGLYIIQGIRETRT